MIGADSNSCRISHLRKIEVVDLMLLDFARPPWNLSPNWPLFMFLCLPWPYLVTLRLLLNRILMSDVFAILMHTKYGNGGHRNVKKGQFGLKFQGGRAKSQSIKSKKYLIRIVPFVSRYVPFHVLLLNPKVKTL